MLGLNEEIDKTEIVSFEIAKLAFKVGFDKPCFLVYNEDGELEYPNDFTGRDVFTIDDIRNTWDNEHPAYLAPYHYSLSNWITELYGFYPVFIFDNDKGIWRHEIKSVKRDLGNLPYTSPEKYNVTISEEYSVYLKNILSANILWY